jgi:hypothetical protein
MSRSHRTRRITRRRAANLALLAILALLLPPPAHSELSGADASAASTSGSLFISEEDGWVDMSNFIASRFGFLPFAVPITEPAVGYGALGGIAFLTAPSLGERAGFARPNITAVGGLGTQNGTWGAFAGDMRHWLDDRLQTLVGAVSTSVNLDFYGLGEDGEVGSRSIEYNLEARGAMVQAKYRIASTRGWLGLNYAFFPTTVTFASVADTSAIPDHSKDSDLGCLIPILSYDSRNNLFTPTAGTYAEVSARLFSEAFGSDFESQVARLTAMQYIPLGRVLDFGVRLDASASSCDTPFYLLPFVDLRGVPMLRYQGQEIAQIEAELRWQCWKRFSLVGFGGAGAASNEVAGTTGTTTVASGGGGFRYELARKYGIHAGVDVGFGPEETAIYIQVGSAWMKP